MFWIETAKPGNNEKAQKLLGNMDKRRAHVGEFVVFILFFLKIVSKWPKTVWFKNALCSDQVDLVNFL